MEFQMRNKTFISSMVGIAAAAAVAGSANAAVVNANGIGSNCLTFDSSTSTPIVYSGFGSTSGTSLRVGFTVESNSSGAGSTVISGIQFSTVEWSKDNGTTWFKFNSNADSFTTSSTSAYAYAVAADFDGNAVLTTMGFLTATSISVTTADTFLVRATMAASVIPNDYKLKAIIALGGNYTERTSTAVPAPGALALLGAAGLVGARRRRA
jgi:hypothetical protein